MLRLLAFDYPEDAVACSLKDEYMFGPSLLICPVTERCIMTGAGNYREKKRAELSSGRQWLVRLPYRKKISGRTVKIIGSVRISNFRK